MDKFKEKPVFILDCQSHNSKLPQYNSVYDHNLKGYFSSRRMVKHLIKTGVLSRTGVVKQTRIGALDTYSPRHVNENFTRPTGSLEKKKDKKSDKSK